MWHWVSLDPTYATFEPMIEGRGVQGLGAFKSSTELFMEGDWWSLIVPAQRQHHTLPPGTKTETEVEAETGRWRELGLEGEGERRAQS